MVNEIDKNVIKDFVVKINLMIDSPKTAGTVNSGYRRPKKLKFIKRNITRSQFHILLEKASQPIKPPKPGT
jgi:hypothetical protein